MEETKRTLLNRSEQCIYRQRKVITLNRQSMFVFQTASRQSPHCLACHIQDMLKMTHRHLLTNAKQDVASITVWHSSHMLVSATGISNKQQLTRRYNRMARDGNPIRIAYSDWKSLHYKNKCQQITCTTWALPVCAMRMCPGSSYKVPTMGPPTKQT